VARTERPARQHERPRAQRQHLAADDPRHGEP